jgi:di/tricarboxylate transporter
MMPLSFAGLMSGMQTLVATTPNMVIDSALIQDGHEGFGFFSFTPIGVVILAAGIGYMMVARKFLRVDPETTRGGASRSMRQYIEDYHLAGREFRVRVLRGSDLVGRAPNLGKGREQYGAKLIAVERHGRFRSEFFEPNSSTVLQAGDVLLLDLPRETNYDRQQAARDLGLQPLPLQGGYFSDRSKEVGMAEILIPPGSDLAGKTVADTRFRETCRLHVIGVRRKNKALDADLEHVEIQPGDTLLVVGTWAAVRQLQSRTSDFLVMTLPAELDQVAPAHRQAPFALASLGIMVLLMVTGVVPNVIAAFIACLLMGVFRCIDLASAYKSINWPILILIVGVMPFAAALERTGGVDLAVEGLLGVVGDAGPRVILASLFIVTALIGMFISNTATAILMAPIALTVAAQLGASPYPFAMTLAIASSAAFMAPISSPVNMLVLAPGRYTFGDFVKIGVPFTFVVLIICILLVPILFPLYPQ